LKCTADQSGCSYHWSTGDDKQESDVSPCTTTQYWCTVTKNGCTSDKDYKTVYVRDVRCKDNSDKDRDKKCVICHYDSKKKAWGHSTVYKSDVSKCQNNGDKFDDCKDFGANINTEESMNVYPNPFNTTASVRVTFATDKQVSIDVVSMDGKVIATIFNGNVTSETPYTFTLDGTNMQSGIYLVRVTSADNVEYRRINLLKDK
ncbi:MAG: T9SS type A sorting domain-containing protein, partial [Legionellales bacterium]